MLVVALSLTAVSTGVCACECRTFESGSEDCPTVTALRHKGRLATEHSGGGRGMAVPRQLYDRGCVEGARAGL